MFWLRDYLTRNKIVKKIMSLMIFMAGLGGPQAIDNKENDEKKWLERKSEKG